MRHRSHPGPVPRSIPDNLSHGRALHASQRSFVCCFILHRRTSVSMSFNSTRKPGSTFDRI
jgi:hypothetical protein